MNPSNILILAIRLALLPVILVLLVFKTLGESAELWLAEFNARLPKWKSKETDPEHDPKMPCICDVERHSHCGAGCDQREENMRIDQTIDTRVADACRRSSASALSFKPKHHEQYAEGQFAGAWHQSLWTSHVDQREIWAEKQAIEAGGGFVIAVDRAV